MGCGSGQQQIEPSMKELQSFSFKILNQLQLPQSAVSYVLPFIKPYIRKYIRNQELYIRCKNKYYCNYCTPDLKPNFKAQTILTSIIPVFACDECNETGIPLSKNYNRNFKCSVCNNQKVPKKQLPNVYPIQKCKRCNGYGIVRVCQRNMNYWKLKCSKQGLIFKDYDCQNHYHCRYLVDHWSQNDYFLYNQAERSKLKTIKKSKEKLQKQDNQQSKENLQVIEEKKTQQR